MLAIQNASFCYGNKLVFENVEFSLARGEVLSILGPNGCGKSTLLNCLSGVLRLRSGEIRIGGEDLRAFSVAEIAQKIGFMSQSHAPVFSYTVREIVQMGRAPYLRLFASPSKEDQAIAEQAIVQMGLKDLAEQPYDQLSGGERQQVLFARIIAQGSQIALLDEPASSLDFGNQYKVMRLIRELANAGYTIVMATHFPDHAMQISDRVMLMSEHTVAYLGTPKETLTSEKLSKLYGVNTYVGYVSEAKRDVCVTGALKKAEQ